MSGVNECKSEAVESHFQEALAKWTDLNSTTYFSQFRRELKPFAQSLIQVLYHKQDIANLIVKHLSVFGSIGLEPILCLVPELARDLQEEFYPHFPSILEAIMRLVDSAQPELVEIIFNTVAFLFKYLSRFIIDDISATFDLLRPAFVHQKPHIHTFAAQSIGFLLRKIPLAHNQQQLAFTHIILSLEINKLKPETVATILFETIKQVKTAFHSKSPAILETIVGIVLRLESESHCKARIEMVLKLLVVIGHYASPESIADLWPVLFKAASQVVDDSAINYHSLDIVMKLIAVWTGLRKGSRIHCGKTLFDMTNKLGTVVLASSSDVCKRTFIKLLALLMESATLDDALVYGRSSLDAITRCSSSDAEIVMLFFTTLHARQYEHFERFILSYTLRFVQSVWTDVPSKCVLFLQMILDSAEAPIRMAQVSYALKDSADLIRASGSVKQPLSKEASIAEALLELIETSVVFNDVGSDETIGTVHSALCVLRHLSAPLPDIISSLETLLRSCMTHLRSSSVSQCVSLQFVQGDRDEMIKALAGKALSVLSERISKKCSSMQIVWDIINSTDMWQVVGKNQCLLQGISDAVGLISNSAESELLTLEHFQRILGVIGPNIGSLESSVRLSTLKILHCFPQSSYLPSVDSKLSGPCAIIQLCLDVETLPNAVSEVREKLLLIRKIETTIASKCIPRLLETPSIRFCLALLSVNFNPLWREATKALVTAANSYQAVFWPLFMEHLMHMKSFYEGENEPSFKSLVELPSHANIGHVQESKKPKNSNIPSSISFECTNVTAFEHMWLKQNSSLGNVNGSIIDRFVAQSIQTNDRIDDTNVFCLLIRLLGDIPRIAEAHSKEIVPLFLEMFDESRVDQLLSVDEQEYGSSEDKMDCEDAEPAHKKDKASVSTKNARTKTLEFLGMMAKLRNPAKMWKSDEVFAVANGLLTKGDTTLQKRAIDCIISWKHPGVVAYAEHLRGMVDDEKFRDFLSSLDMEALRASVRPEDQPMLMKVLCRILYGKLISRRGRQSAKSGLRARRIAIFAFLASVQENERQIMVDLMLEPFHEILKQPDLDGGSVFFINDSLSVEALGSIKQQLGFLSVVEDFIKQLRSRIAPHMPQILKTVLYLLHYAEKANIEAQTEDDECTHKREGYELNQLRDVRLQSVGRLTLMFTLEIEFDFKPYISALYSSYISRRVEKLSTENTQSPTALLELLLSWSKNADYAWFLLDYNKDLLPSFISILSAKKVREPVVSAILSAIESLQDLHELSEADEIAPKLIVPHVPVLLENIESVLSQSIGVMTGTKIRLGLDNIPTRIIHILSRLSSFVTISTNAEQLVNILVPFLRKPDRAVSEETKTGILKILGDFLPIMPVMKETHVTKTQYYTLVCRLFISLASREARTYLLRVFKQFVEFDKELLSDVYSVLDDMNSFSTKRLDEPDFDRRFNAFARVSRGPFYEALQPQQWRPILCNLVFYTKEEEEYAVRTSASFAIQQFISLTATLPIPPPMSERPSKELLHMDLVLYMICNEVKAAFKNNSMQVRQEYVTILGLLVQTFPSVSNFADMVVLLANGDEEASFFSNVYHMQIHRRLKALRNFATECLNGSIRSTNISSYFVPILNHFIFESDRVHDHNVINEAVNALGACSNALNWSHYYALTKRYMNLAEKKPDSEKLVIRVLIQILDRFHFQETVDKYAMEIDTTGDVDDESDDGEESGDVSEFKQVERREDITEFNPEKVNSIMINKVLPHLQKLVAFKDDETVPIRIPLAIAIVKILKQLRPEAMELQLPKVLITLCNIMTSHLQTTRDATRSTLVNIAVMLGPEKLSYIVSELQTALKRGYQLHILGYTLHSILDGLVPTIKPGLIDDCLKPMVDICINDIFGETGKEREVVELRGKMRESKNSKSFDSFELLSKSINFGSVNVMLLSLKELMVQSDNSKVLKQIQDVFRRLAIGLNVNESIDTDALIEFIRGLVTENLSIARIEEASKPVVSNSERNFKVQLKRSAVAEPLAYFQANAHFFVEFGLSLLLTALKRERISLKDAHTFQLLDGLVDTLGSALYSKHLPINMMSMRILCVIIKAKLPALEEALPPIVKRIFKLIARSTSTNSELVQTCFRLLTVILRDCDHNLASEKQIITLTAMIKPDLESPERQSTTFSLIRAILTRKYVVTEIYELMDIIVRLLVTSQDGHLRELARHAYIQFLTAYPHGHASMRKQITYMVKNMEYEHESGRISILEVMNTMLTKFELEVLSQYSDMIFLSLVMMLVNDVSSKCREMAAVLINVLVKRLGIFKADQSIKLVSKWIQSDEIHLKRTAAQVYGLFVQAFEVKAKKWLNTFLKHLRLCLAFVTDEVRAHSLSDSVDDENEGTGLQRWELGYYALNTLSKIASFFPNEMLQDDEDMRMLWQYVSELLEHPHQWVRSVTSKMMGQVFSALDATTRARPLEAQSCSKENANVVFCLLETESEIKRVASRLCLQLDSTLVSPELAKQVVINLLFIGKCMVHIDTSATADCDNDKDDDEEAGIVDESASLTKKAPLLWLTQKLSYLARLEVGRKRGPTLRRSVFQWFSAISTHIPQQEYEPYYLSMIATLYRTAKDETLKGADAEQLRQLATQVMEHLQKNIGTIAYVELYNKVQRHIEEVRRDRRSQRAIQAVADPEAHARRRIQKNEMKRSSRKRKAESFASSKIRMSVTKKRHNE